MKNVTFITILGISMLSIVNCQWPGDYVISDSNPHLYNGLNVPGNLLVSGSGPIRVIGDANVGGDYEHSGSGDFHATGRIFVRGKLTTPGSGRFRADGGIVSYNQNHK